VVLAPSLIIFFHKADRTHIYQGLRVSAPTKKKRRDLIGPDFTNFRICGAPAPDPSWKTILTGRPAGMTAMFKAISNLWQVTRGTELFKQVNQMATSTLPNLQGQAAARCTATVISEMPLLCERTANFAHVSNEGRKQIAKSLFAEARKCFDLDVGRGTALAMIAIYVESSALPGGDARMAHAIAGQMIATIEKVHADANALSDREG
jgi:hypothetical protein